MACRLLEQEWASGDDRARQGGTSSGADILCRRGQENSTMRAAPVLHVKRCLYQLACARQDEHII